MSVIFEQTEDIEKHTPTKKSLFWKNDGKVVLIVGQKQIEDITLKGLTELSTKEKLKFKPGDYNPVHDLRLKETKLINNNGFFIENKNKHVSQFNVLSI